MRRVCWLLFVMMCAAVALGHSAPVGAVVDSVKITSLPSTAIQAGVEHVNATVVGQAKACSLTVRYADGTSQALGSKRVIAHRVGWTWKVASAAAPGRASVGVACGVAGRAKGSFTVQRRLTPAQVAVVKSGVTQVPDGFDSGTQISYGVVLINKSPDEDALDVQVGVNLLDASGHVIGSDTNYVDAILAGATYYLGGELSTHDATQVASVQPIIQIGDSKPKSIVAPAVTNVRVVPKSYDTSAYVDGQVTNQASVTLGALAEITAVFFDSAGNVIGGGFTFPPFALPPGASAAFEIITPVQAAAIASVQVSVEPDYGP